MCSVGVAKAVPVQLGTPKTPQFAWVAPVNDPVHVGCAGKRPSSVGGAGKRPQCGPSILAGTENDLIPTGDGTAALLLTGGAAFRLTRFSESRTFLIAHILLSG